MSTFIIPVSETTDPFDQQVELDGRIFDLVFRWNPRGIHWSMDIGRDGNVLVAGIKVITDGDILNQYQRIADLPDGILFVDDLDGLDTDPDDENFGDRVVLKYTEAA